MTDHHSHVSWDQVERPGVANLITMYGALCSPAMAPEVLPSLFKCAVRVFKYEKKAPDSLFAHFCKDVVKLFQGQTTHDFKRALARLVCSTLVPIQERMNK